MTVQRDVERLSGGEGRRQLWHAFSPCLSRKVAGPLTTCVLVIDQQHSPFLSLLPLAPALLY